MIAPADRGGFDASFRLPYQPALDGLRAIAVILVVVFHLDIGVFGGGYLGVSVFFTLSGFLITALLLGEVDLGPDPSDQRIALGRFYVRRFKRLLPASVATLIAVVALAAVGLVTATASLGGDITAAAWNVFNWRELSSGDSYTDLFVDESPVAHFWSLAIEEQFYLVWPLVIVLLTRVMHLRRRGLLIAFSALFVASAASAIAASPDVAYLATHTRAAEILAGALLATWMATGSSTSWPRWWRKLGMPALGLVLLAAVLTPTSSGWAYSGGLAGFAWVSVALIAGLQTSGSARSLLSIAPLVALGRISYGVYLVHWPVFVVLDERRLGTDGWSLAAVRLSVTAAIALAMYFVVERPIRGSRRALRPIAAGALAVTALLTVTFATVLFVPRTTVNDPAAPVIGAAASPVGDDESATAPVAPDAGRDALGPESITGSDDPPSADSAIVPAATRAAADRGVAPPPVAHDVPVTIAVFGDSVPAWLLRDAAAAFVRTDAVVLNGALEACDGMIGLPPGRDRRSIEFVLPEDCLDWRTSYPRTLANAAATDVGLLVLGQAPVVDRLVDGRWQGPCESIDWYLDDLVQRVEYLRAAGTRPVLAIPARFGRHVAYIVTDDHEQRIQCVRRALTAAAVDLAVDVIDLDELLCPAEDCDAVRSADGIHVDPDAAPAVLDALLDRVIATVRTDAPTDEPGPLRTSSLPVR